MIICIRRFSRSSVLMLLVVISPLWRSREARMTSQTPVPKRIWTCSTVSVYRIPPLTYSTGNSFQVDLVVHPKPVIADQISSTGGSPSYKPDANTPTNSNEPYLDWLNFILNQTTISQTYSTSYGDDEQTVPPDYATSVCNGFAQLGSRGASIMISSGDSG